MQYDLNIIVNCDFQCIPVQILQHVSHTACIVVSVSCIPCCLPLHHLYLVFGLASFLDHTVEQYSKFGQTIVKYAEALVSWLLIRRSCCCKKPSMLLPFFTFLSMWVFHERLAVRSTPMYFEWDSACRICPSVNNHAVLAILIL